MIALSLAILPPEMRCIGNRGHVLYCVDAVYPYCADAGYPRLRLPQFAGIDEQNLLGAVRDPPSMNWLTAIICFVKGWV